MPKNGKLREKAEKQKTKTLSFGFYLRDKTFTARVN